MKEEDKIDVKIEADSVDDVRFPSTCTEELINIKREMTEATAFVAVKAETDSEVGCNGKCFTNYPYVTSYNSH
jgi:hypothetical protein